MNWYRVGAWLAGVIGAVAGVGGTYAVIRAHKPFYGLAVMLAVVALAEAVEWLRTAGARQAARR